MKIRSAFRLINEFVIFTDNNSDIFKYDREDPFLDQELKTIHYERLSRDKYALRFCCDNSDRYIISNKDGFTYVEELMISDIIDVINKFSRELSYNELYMLLRSVRLDTILKAITKYENGQYRSVLHSQSRQILINHIMKMDEWSGQTYENGRISFSLGMDITTDELSDIHITDLYDDAMLMALGSGNSTIVVCNREGGILRYEELGEPFMETDNAPLLYGDIAHWSKGRIAVTLTPDGEILIFYDQTFLYLKRIGKWYPANSSPLYHRMQSGSGYNNAMKSALINTCYDVSFRRCGACIGVVDPDCPLIYDIDRYAISGTSRAAFFRQILGTRKFQEIGRRIRQELVGIDGATVIDKDGNVLAVGAILRINTSDMQNRTTGGRSVAAQQLAEYGIGIKISVDGSIEAWRKNSSGHLEKFIEVL